MAPGTETQETITHDFWEEVWILRGPWSTWAWGRTFGARMYACRPPGMRHGPYRSVVGALLFETRYRQ